MAAPSPFPSSSPASSSSALPSGDHGGRSFGNGNQQRPLGLLENAMKRKGSFIQLFAMTNIFFLSLRSLGQKYRMRELADENFSLREERDSLALRMDSIKYALIQEADLDPTGLLAFHLHGLF